MPASMFTPGQMLTCRVESIPHADGRKQTILRLMRNDPAIKRGLRKAQKLRRQNMETHGRGGRVWHVRRHPGKIARAVVGAEWQMRYTPLMDSDLNAVQGYITVEQA